MGGGVGQKVAYFLVDMEQSVGCYCLGARTYILMSSVTLKGSRLAKILCDSFHLRVSVSNSTPSDLISRLSLLTPDQWLRYLLLSQDKLIIGRLCQ